ncbi:PD40 domain-containing protein [Schlesneria paludicola]|uniref:PD40 domain-containing protein n=1 Tax=Schlesneria paludicola TaxID=360056 RepID=UPI000492C1A2|nr:PD40 domain-containing protein [Schlesneria paludicola]
MLISFRLPLCLARPTSLILLAALVAGSMHFCFGLVEAAEAPQLAIYAMNGDGGELRQVAQAPGKRWHAAPSWSPDGKLVVFHAYTGDAETADSHIFTVHDDGAELKDLGQGRDAAWSPDGKQLLFSIAEKNPEKEQVGVWVMNADGKGRQWMFAGYAPVFAPDGSRILFVSSHEGNQSIYVYDMIEGSQKKILQEAYQKKPGSARWSADGKKVAFIDERDGKSVLIVIDAAGSEKEQAVRHRGLIGGPIAWAPNPKMTLWSREKDPNDPQQLSVIAADGDDPPAGLPNQDKGTLNFDPAWSLDNQRLVFVSDRGK